MSKIQRMVLESVLTLSVITLIITMPSVSLAEPASALTGESALIGSTGSKSAMPESFLPLGMALISLAMMVRRKTA